MSEPSGPGSTAGQGVGSGSRRHHAPLAQLAEHRTLNPQVLGSSPRGRTEEIPGQRRSGRAEVLDSSSLTRLIWHLGCLRRLLDCLLDSVRWRACGRLSRQRSTGPGSTTCGSAPEPIEGRARSGSPASSGQQSRWPGNSRTARSQPTTGYRRAQREPLCRVTRTIKGSKFDASRTLAALSVEVQSGERVPGSQNGSQLPDLRHDSGAIDRSACPLRTATGVGFPSVVELRGLVFGAVWWSQSFSLIDLT